RAVRAVGRRYQGRPQRRPAGVGSVRAARRPAPISRLVFVDEAAMPERSAATARAQDVTGTTGKVQAQDGWRILRARNEDLAVASPPASPVKSGGGMRTQGRRDIHRLAG